MTDYHWYHSPLRNRMGTVPDRFLDNVILVRIPPAVPRSRRVVRRSPWGDGRLARRNVPSVGRKVSKNSAVHLHLHLRPSPRLHQIKGNVAKSGMEIRTKPYRRGLRDWRWPVSGCYRACRRGGDGTVVDCVFNCPSQTLPHYQIKTGV